MNAFRSMLGRRARDYASRRLFRQQWNCAIIRQPIDIVAGLGGADAQAAALASAIWLPEPPGGYVADPFGYWTDDGECHIFAEKLDVATNHGSIVMCRFRDDKFSDYVDVLNLPTHLSYPYLFDNEGRRFVIPENSAGKTLKAYSLDGDGLVVEAHDILDGIALVDASIVSWEGRYWMFAIRNVDQWNAELNIFHADDPFGSWHPHVGNPVKVDNASSRSAGTPFLHGGRLYRPAQNCSNSYGKEVVVNVIAELSVERFSETPVSTVSSTELPVYNRSLHTISSVGDCTLIDASRKVMRDFSRNSDRAARQRD